MSRADSTFNLVSDFIHPLLLLSLVLSLRPSVQSLLMDGVWLRCGPDSICVGEHLVTEQNSSAGSVGACARIKLHPELCISAQLLSHITNTLELVDLIPRAALPLIAWPRWPILVMQESVWLGKAIINKGPPNKVEGLFVRIHSFRDQNDVGRVMSEASRGKVGLMIRVSGLCSLSYTVCFRERYFNPAYLCVWLGWQWTLLNLESLETCLSWC